MAQPSVAMLTIDGQECMALSASVSLAIASDGPGMPQMGSLGCGAMWLVTFPATGTCAILNS